MEFVNRDLNSAIKIRPLVLQKARRAELTLAKGLGQPLMFEVHTGQIETDIWLLVRKRLRGACECVSFSPVEPTLSVVRHSRSVSVQGPHRPCRRYRRRSGHALGAR